MSHRPMHPDTSRLENEGCEDTHASPARTTMRDQRPDWRSVAHLAHRAGDRSGATAARIRLQRRRRAIAAGAVTTAVAAVVIIPPVFLETSPTTRCEQQGPPAVVESGNRGASAAPPPARPGQPSPTPGEDCVDEQGVRR
jgi:hypothetical protein